MTCNPVLMSPRAARGAWRGVGGAGGACALTWTGQRVKGEKQGRCSCDTVVQDKAEAVTRFTRVFPGDREPTLDYRMCSAT